MRKLPDGMRERVLEAASLIAEHGLDATKMEDIAAATGVPKATLYYHFEGKEAILAFLFAEIHNELDAAIDEAANGPGSAADRLRAVVVAYLRVVHAFPAASRALQFDLGRAARLPTISQRTDAVFLDPVQALLVAGAADGSLRPVDHPRLVATAILGAVVTTGINALTSSAADPRPRTRSVNHVARELTAFILEGVTS
ncbi:MAG: TetR/AcrR family transcriptional regulator [Actinomycetota bacterium]|nr:TetR/AcrR family transcriptional regulator [Actinomycetota bacterium]